MAVIIEGVNAHVFPYPTNWQILTCDVHYSMYVGFSCACPLFNVIPIAFQVLESQMVCSISIMA